MKRTPSDVAIEHVRPYMNYYERGGMVSLNNQKSRLVYAHFCALVKHLKSKFPRSKVIFETQEMWAYHGSFEQVDAVVKKFLGVE